MFSERSLVYQLLRVCSFTATLAGPSAPGPDQRGGSVLLFMCSTTPRPSEKTAGPFGVIRHRRPQAGQPPLEPHHAPDSCTGMPPRPIAPATPLHKSASTCIQHPQPLHPLRSLGPSHLMGVNAEGLLASQAVVAVCGHRCLVGVLTGLSTC
jgi:hypothetical protein